MSVTARSSWALVGRGAELKQIVRARTDGSAGAVLIGAAGVGKSRLAREALAAAAGSGAEAIWVQATRSAAVVPLGAFAGVIPSQARSDDLFALLHGSVESLRSRARGRALVVGVDDAQLLDPMSAALVLHLASTGTAFVVATIRSGEQPPDAIEALWKDTDAVRIDLAVLDQSEIDELVQEMVGGRVEREVRRWAQQTSGGNALYLRELVAGAISDGALREERGAWRLAAVPTVSASLAEFVQVRLSGIPSEQIAVLELLALGEPLQLAELEPLTGSGPLGEVEQRQLVTIGGTGPGSEVRLAHPLYGEVIRAGLPALRARDIRLRLAGMFDAREQLTEDETLKLARWLSDAGAPIEQRVLLAAASAAINAGDADFAGELARQAIDAGAGVPAQLLLARALIIQRRLDEAQTLLGALESCLDTRAHALDYLETQSELLHWGLGRPRDLGELLDRAGTWWDDARWRESLGPLRARLASFLHLGAEPPRDLLEQPRAQKSRAPAVAPVEVANRFYAGRTAEARELALVIRPRPPLRTLDDAIALSLWSRILQETGEDWVGLESWMTAVLHEGVRVRDHAAAGQAAYSLAALAYHGARYADAQGLLAEARAQLARHDPVGLLVVADALDSVVACVVGDHEAAAAALSRCRARIGGDSPLPHQFPYVARAEAWAAWSQADRPRARQLLLEAAERMKTSPVHAARLKYEALRCGASASALAKDLRKLADRCDARLVAAYADHAAARAADDGTALLEVAAVMESIGTRRYAAEAAAHAADAFARSGRRDSARRAAARSRELTPIGQDAQTPAMEAMDDPYTNLTEREVQLVELARSGLSNAEIAERLVLSVRTIESHLYRAMQKLGVSSRTDL